MLFETNNLIQNFSKYFLQVVWKNDTNVFVTWVNRRQDKSSNVMYDVSKLTYKPVDPEVVGLKIFIRCIILNM